MLDIVGVTSNMVGGIANAFSGGLGALANTTAAAAKSAKPSGNANQRAALNSQIATKETQKEQLQEKLDKQNGELDALVDELEQQLDWNGHLVPGWHGCKNPYSQAGAMAFKRKNRLRPGKNPQESWRFSRVFNGGIRPRD